MNNENNDKIIDVESLPVNGGQQVAWENCFQNTNDDTKKKKGRGIRRLGKIAGMLFITMIGGVFGSTITYSLMASNNVVATKQIISSIPQSFTPSTSNAMSAADAFNKVAPA